MCRSYCAQNSSPARHDAHSASSAAKGTREVAVNAHSVAILAWRDPEIAAARALAVAAEGGDAVEVPAALVDGDGDGLVAEVLSAQEDLVAVAVVCAVEPGGWRKLVSLVCVAEACGSVLDVGDGDCDAAAESDMLASEATVMAK